MKKDNGIKPPLNLGKRTISLPICKRCKRKAPVCAKRHICLQCEKAEGSDG
jgi:hypothetical protein